MKSNLFKIIISILIAVLLIFGFIYIISYEEVEIINNYDKEYIINKYKREIDSNLSIFPDKSILNNFEFKSIINTNLIDITGYIILKNKYNENDFNNEINRLKNINISIKNSCYENSEVFTNYIIYDDINYNYPAYISIDGFSDIYEYALVNDKELEIIYIYLKYPNINDSIYKNYLKKDKSLYNNENSLDKYSIYNHTFDNGKSYSEFDDCSYENN